MTSREAWVRVKPLLERALERAPEDRPAYLDEACGGDEALRQEALRLLAACERARRSLEFLESPAVELAAPLLEVEAESLSASGELAPGVALGPYVLEKYLGAGGMGVVYLAHDPRLDRRVALKLLPAWLPVDDEVSRRLTEEARAASRLDHPNIQTVYEIGRAPDGRPFIAMAYYEGETLKDRIAHGPLDVDAALDLACQIAGGLGAAHRLGIVHRDVKPGNVMVTPAGVAKILDFGAAKIAGRAPRGADKALGTVAYMSPEQTRGEDLDARTDVWSLGVLLHEMLAGTRPFAAEGADALVHAIRRDPATPLSSLRPDVPDVLSQVVQRCLEKDPRARFENGTSLAEELTRVRNAVRATAARSHHRVARRSFVATAVIGIVLAGVAVYRSERSTIPTVEGAVQPTEPPPSRLAVLPVQLVTARAEDGYLVDALTEEMITALSRVPALRVTALASVMPYQGTDARPDEIADELGVETLLTSSVGEAGDDVHLSALLMAAPSGEQLWAKEYVTSMVGLQSVVGLIASEAAEALRVEATSDSPRLAAETESADALEAYYKGRHFLAKLATPGATQQAREYFEQAIDLDPTFAPAWAGLAGAYDQLAIQGALPTRDAEPRAREAAQRALAIDPGLADAYTPMAAAESWYYWDDAGAERDFRHALELDPSSARAHRSFSVHLRNHGRFDEALTMIRTAGELDPLSPGAYLQEGVILYMARRYEDALMKYRQLLAVEPGYVTTYFYIALADIQMGRPEDALDALGKTDPIVTAGDVRTIRGYALARLGRIDEARRELARFEALPASGAVSFARAVILVGLGEHERAVDLLEKAIEDRPWQMQLLGVEPVFDPLRSNPRFQALLGTLGLAE